MALRSPLRGWPVWQLPRWLAACVTAVIAAYAAAVAGALASTPVRPGDLRLCAVFVGCGAASVELTRRAGEREGLARDVYAIWDLSAAVLLPPLYALVIPLPRAVLTEWRIRRTLLHRRAYSTAAHGLAYAAASLVFRSAVPALCGGGAGSGGHALAWITLAAGCGLVSMAVQACLILPPVKATAAPGTRLRSLVLGREAVCNQVTELCLAVLTAFAAAHSALALVVALPLVIVLQRSLRHASLAAAARTDAKTGLLNAGAWQREAAVEVTRAPGADSAGGRHRRHRPLQSRQRHSRPPRRGRRARRGLRRHAGPAARLRPVRPVRRRGIRPAAPPHHSRPGPRDHRADPPGDLPARHPPGRHRGNTGHHLYRRRRPQPGPPHPR